MSLGTIGNALQHSSHPSKRPEVKPFLEDTPLYTDDTNVPEGRLRDEARSEPASSDEEGEEPAAVVAGGRAGRRLDV